MAILNNYFGTNTIGYSNYGYFPSSTASVTLPLATNNSSIFNNIGRQLQISLPDGQIVNGYGVAINSNVGVDYISNNITIKYWPNSATAATSSDIYLKWVNGLQAFEFVEDLTNRIRKLIRNRIAPQIYTHARPLGFTKDLREVRARETLHRVLGDEKYKSFLRKGFVSVRAKSGLVYQIYPSHDFTKVYDCGKMVDRYCVVLQGNFPPTDSLIMRYLLILNNEQMFKNLAIKHGIVTPEIVQMPEQKSLAEMFKEMKRAA